MRNPKQSESSRRGRRPDRSGPKPSSSSPRGTAAGARPPVKGGHGTAMEQVRGTLGGAR